MFSTNANLDDIVNGAVWQYDLLSLDNQAVSLNQKDNKKITALKLSSKRYSTPPANIASMANVWVDNYDTNGWAYLEGNTVIRHQEKLVDTKFLTDVFTYDNESAEKEFEIDIHDPFKGVIPGFIDAEIDFKSDLDPCIYDVEKAEWGSRQVGRRWWATDTMRYEWYEQGAGTYAGNGYNNQERAVNWGNLFPGSVINIFEWTENLVPPALYDGEGYALNETDFVTEVRGNSKNEKPQELSLIHI